MPCRESWGYGQFIFLKKCFRETPYPTVNAKCVFDNCSDGNWISSSLANKLPKHKVKKVQLNLTTMSQKGNFETKEHSFLIKVKDNFKAIKAYETSSIGTSMIDSQESLQVS